MTLIRKQIRVQKDNQREIDYEISRIQKNYPDAYVKPSLKPVEIVDIPTQDCNMWIDIIF